MLFLAFLVNLYYYKQLNMKIRFRISSAVRGFFSAWILIVVFMVSGMPLITEAQQALPKIDSEQLKKISGESAEIEALIIRATPHSITEARQRIETSLYLSAPDKAALGAIASGIGLILYGPKDSRFEIPAAAQGASQKYIACLVGLVDAFAGKYPQIFASEPCSTLTELISSLPYFRSAKSEVREKVNGALSRFDALGGVSVVPMLIRGQIALDSKEYGTAEKEFSSALALDTKSEKSACGFARASLALGKLQAAKNALDPIATGVIASNTSAEFKALYGLTLYNLNNVLDAEAWLASALKDDPGRTEVLVPLAEAAIQKRDYSAASRYLESAAKAFSQDRTWLVLKSQYALENSRQADAERFARSAVRYFPKDPVALSQLILALEKSTDEVRHAEAVDLAKAVLDLAMNKETALVPLEEARRAQARNQALQFLVSESYNHQDWVTAAAYLQAAGGLPLDKNMVATILRKSGNIQASIQFASSWYAQEPGSEKAVEAYLRSLAMATGGGLASAASASDVHTGLGIALSALGIGKDGSANSALLDLVLKFIAAPYSKELKSFLYYMSASLQSDENKAIDQLKDALAERADNVEALVSLADIYLARYNRQFDKRDTTNRDKAIRYLGQAKALSPTDKDLLARISQLEAQLK